MKRPRQQPSTPSPTAAEPAGELGIVVRRHLKFGWWTLLVFLTAGLALEGLHGFKIGFYLNVSNETRRLMWTLGHAHGTLLGLIQLGFAFTSELLPGWAPHRRLRASNCLIGSTVLITAGFFLGGAFARGGDPGLGIILLPLGAVLLFTAIFLTGQELRRSPRA